MKSFLKPLLAGAWMLVLLHSYSSLAFDGRVFDASTGKPAAGTWVFQQYGIGGGFVISQSACIVAVARTGGEGRFTLTSRDWAFGRPFIPTNVIGVYTYKKGYMDRLPQGENATDFFIEPDTRPALERLEYLESILSVTDCGTQYMLDHKTELLPLYRAVNEEGVKLAKSTKEKFVMVTITYKLNLLERGPEAASEIAEKTALLLLGQSSKGE